MFSPPVEPSEIQLFVNQVAAHGAKRILLGRGVQVSLRCEGKAEPRPTFLWRFPGTITAATRPYRVSGITWRQTIFLRSMSCRSSGTFVCGLQNLGKHKLARVAIGVTGLFVTKIRSCKVSKEFMPKLTP